MVRAGCPPDQLRAIHSPAPDVENGVSPLPRTDPPRFLYLGRLVPQKGLSWLLRSFAEVSPAAHLDIAGEGPQLENMKALARGLGIRSRVTFHGWVESTRVPSLIRRSRAVVFPSVWHEPAGLISLEAAAYGRALISSRVGGIPEYTNEDRALLVEAGDQDGLADAISLLAQDGDQAQRMGKCGAKGIRSDFSMSDFLDALRAFYRSSIQDRMELIGDTK
jgi:glycosyltransferase involved in cell wall biosynthesis